MDITALITAFTWDTASDSLNKIYYFKSTTLPKSGALNLERCNRMVADVAMKIVDKLNQYVSNELKFTEKLNEFSEGCISCHGPEQEKADVSANMSCNICHENPHNINETEKIKKNLKNGK